MLPTSSNFGNNIKKFIKLQQLIFQQLLDLKIFWEMLLVIISIILNGRNKM